MSPWIWVTPGRGAMACRSTATIFTSSPFSSRPLSGKPTQLLKGEHIYIENKKKTKKRKTWVSDWGPGSSCRELHTGPLLCSHLSKRKSINGRLGRLLLKRQQSNAARCRVLQVGLTCEQVELVVQLQQLEGTPRPPALLFGQTVVNVPLVFGWATHRDLWPLRWKSYTATVTHQPHLYWCLFLHW